MQTIPNNIPAERAIRKIRSAAYKGIYDGTQLTLDYFKNCRWFWKKYNCTLIFTRDEGHHTCGWWKNPDYERCYHLSISFRSGSKNGGATLKILKAIYGSNHKLIWSEPPYSKEGVELEVWHYRLFCDEAWKVIKPRGEVYSKKFTEIGWKSFSEVQAINKQLI